MLLISSSRAVAQISSCWIYRTCLNVQYVGREINSNKFLLQGSKKVPSSSPGQVDFLAGQVTFKAHLPNKVKNNWSSNRIINQEKQKVALTKQNYESCLPQGQAGLQDFSNTVLVLYSIFHFFMQVARGHAHGSQRESTVSGSYWQSFSRVCVSQQTSHSKP